MNAERLAFVPSSSRSVFGSRSHRTIGGGPALPETLRLRFHEGRAARRRGGGETAGQGNKNGSPVQDSESIRYPPFVAVSPLFRCSRI